MKAMLNEFEIGIFLSVAFLIRHAENGFSKLGGLDVFTQAEGHEILQKKNLPPVVDAELRRNKEIFSHDGYYFNILTVKQCMHPEGQEDRIRFTIIVNNHYRDHKGSLMRWDYDIDIATQSLVAQRECSRIEDAWFFNRDTIDQQLRYRDVPTESVHDRVVEAIQSHPGFVNREELQSIHIDVVREVRTADLLSEHPEKETVHLEGMATVHPSLKTIGKFLTQSKQYVKLQSVVPFRIQDDKVSLTLRKTSYEEEVLYSMDLHDIKNLAEDSPGAQPFDSESDGLGPKDEPGEDDDPAEDWKNS